MPMAGDQVLALPDAARCRSMRVAPRAHTRMAGCMEALILVPTQGGPTMLARIGIMRALNRHVERVFNPSRKETHWGSRKLARDR